jgi:hypothetical protein
VSSVISFTTTPRYPQAGNETNIAPTNATLQSHGKTAIQKASCSIPQIYASHEPPIPAMNTKGIEKDIIMTKLAEFSLKLRERGRLMRTRWRPPNLHVRDTHHASHDLYRSQCKAWDADDSVED